MVFYPQVDGLGVARTQFFKSILSLVFYFKFGSIYMLARLSWKVQGH